MPTQYFTKKHAALSASIKFICNTIHRIPYPLVPFFVSLNLSPSAVAASLAAHEAPGLLLPFFPLLQRRYRWKSLFFWALTILVAGVGVSAAVPHAGTAPLALFVLALVLTGIGFFGITPLLQTAIARKAREGTVGLVTGLTESSWSLSTLVGVPVFSALLASSGTLTLPWLVFGALLLPVYIAPSLYPNMDDDDGPSDVEQAKQPPTHNEQDDAGTTVGASLRALAASMRALPGTKFVILFTFITGFANNILASTYALHFSARYDLDIRGIAAVTTVGLGAAEFVASALSGTLADRLGAARSLVASCTCLTIAYAAFAIISDLPGTPVAASVAALFVMFIFFEFNIVCSFTHYSIRDPAHADTNISLCFFAASTGRLCGAAFSDELWLAGNERIVLGAWTMAGLNALGTASLVYSLILDARSARDKETTPGQPAGVADTDHSRTAAQLTSPGKARLTSPTVARAAASRRRRARRSAPATRLHDPVSDGRPGARAKRTHRDGRSSSWRRRRSNA